ncbi:MAG: hypothetical protein OXF79_00945 [Chloroflexi bacterium]|nr:hypothetical protein [Chloroflexota bacterium]
MVGPTLLADHVGPSVDPEPECPDCSNAVASVYCSGNLRRNLRWALVSLMTA